MSNFLTAVSNLIRGLAGLTIAVLLAVGGLAGRASLQQSLRPRSGSQKEDRRDRRARPTHIERLDKEVAEKNKRIQQLDMAVRLLKVDVRLAEIVVLKQWTSEATKKEMTQFQFVEIDERRDIRWESPRCSRSKGTSSISTATS